MHLLHSFARVAVVNLPSRRDRRRLISRELKSIGASLGDRIQLFPAIRPPDAGDFPSLGARGCYMSHLSILRNAVADKVANIVILEDDLQFARNFAEVQASVLGALVRVNWDIAYFGHACDVDAADIPLVEAKFPIAMTHFYAVNAHCLPRLVSFLELVLTRPAGDPRGGPMHVDGAISTFREQNSDIRTVLAAPSLGGQRSSYSDIAPRQWFDRTPIIREMATAAREVKSWLRN